MRSICNDCLYPIKTCICDAVTPIPSQLPIHIIQHYKETKNAKNTVRLAKLCLPKTSLNTSISKTNKDIHAITQSFAHKRVAIIYPSKCSREIEHDMTIFKKNDYKQIVFIDGSWRQAEGIYQSLVQQRDFDTWRIGQVPDSHYYIRHTTKRQGISTLEAIAATITLIERLDVSPAYRLLDAFQQHWQGPQSKKPKHE